MDSNEDQFDVEEENSDVPVESNVSGLSGSSIVSSAYSSALIHDSSPETISEGTYKRRMDEYVEQLKIDLQKQCQLDWLNKFQSWKHNPKVELNLLLHGAIREQFLKQLALPNGISSDEQLVQNDHCLFQRIMQEIIDDQREQRIIYTEILFRPEVFHLMTDTSHPQLKKVINVLIDSIRYFTSTDAKSTDPLIPYVTNPLPTHVKLLLSCHWTQVKLMHEYIQLAHQYSDEIVGFDLYGSEDDCRNHWHQFRKYTNLLRQWRMQWQASMSNYQDPELIMDVAKGLNLQRLADAYTISESERHTDEIFIKHGIHLVVCPTSPAYAIANEHIKRTGVENLLKLSSLIDHLQRELISYSITSLRPQETQQNLSTIYKDLLDSNREAFTCEHMLWLNENAINSSFASQRLKCELINYLRTNYANCYQQTVLLQQFQEAMEKWQGEMNHIIDRNAQIAMEFAMKMRQEKQLQRLDRQQEMQTKRFDDDDEEEEMEQDDLD